jgi:hypothetical protein
MLGGSSSSSTWLPRAAAAGAAAEGISPDGAWPGRIAVQPAGIIDPGVVALYGQIGAGDAFQAAAEGPGVGDVQGEVERELQYALYCAQGRTAPDNKQCCFPG